MEFDNLFKMSNEGFDDELFKHNNINEVNMLSSEADDEDSLPEPPEMPSMDDEGGENNSESGDDSSNDSGDGGGEGEGSDDNSYGSSGGNSEPIEKNVSPNPFALINGRQELFENFIELRESISGTIEMLSTKSEPKTVEINRLKKLKEVVSKNIECVYTQPINESLQIFGVMTQHYSNIVKLIESKLDSSK